MKKYKFNEFIILHDKKRIPLSSIERKKRQGNYRYYGAQGVIDHINDYIFDGKFVLLAEDGENLKSKKQNIAQYVTGKFWVNNHAHIITTTDICRLKYFYYLINTIDVSEYITGSAQPKLSQISMNKMEFEIPEIKVQDKILSILNAIDKKITLNNEINKNLEQQAQAIFDDMFPGIFSLNTDATLQDLIVFANGKKRPKTIGNIPVYGGNGILAYTDKSNADNCVIIGRVGAYCGNTFLCLDKCWTSDNAIQAKNRTGSSPLFIYYLLRNASLSSRHIGTGQPLMTQGILNAIPIKYPAEEKISAFIETCSPIHKMISANRQQNESLVSIRDSMIPKLMSGELDVSNLDF